VERKEEREREREREREKRVPRVFDDCIDIRGEKIFHLR
jgi:hypothetical protein